MRWWFRKNDQEERRKAYIQKINDEVDQGNRERGLKMSELYNMAKDGMSIAEIAVELNLAENTVRQSIRYKLEADKLAREQRTEFTQLYYQMKDLLTNHRRRDSTYVAPVKTNYFVSESLDECAALYPKQRSNATVIGHMSDVIDQMEVDAIMVNK